MLFRSSGEQRAAVHRLLTRERLVDCLIAAAGSGKTYSLNLAREMWEGSGYRVIGASLAARAASPSCDVPPRRNRGDKAIARTRMLCRPTVQIREVIS